MTSQSSAAAPIVANCVATVASIMRRRCSADGATGGVDGLADANFFTSGPIGATGKLKPSIQPLKSGGTHSRTSCPRSRSSSASATRGRTSPRDPIVERKMRMGRTYPFLARGGWFGSRLRAPVLTSRRCDMRHSLSGRALRFLLVLIAGMLISLQSGRADTTWHVRVGAQSKDLGRQALAFLPNEIWIHEHDSITFQSGVDEPHTVTFMTPPKTRPVDFTQG